MADTPARTSNGPASSNCSPTSKPAARSRIIAHSEEVDPHEEMMRILSMPRLARDFSQAAIKPQ
jgi:hypothetical protein